MSAELESENARLRERLAQWEKAFETTNPSQAEAEHLAVLEKRKALTEAEHLAVLEIRKALTDQLAAAHTKIREQNADLTAAIKALPHREEQ